MCDTTLVFCGQASASFHGANLIIIYVSDHQVVLRVWKVSILYLLPRDSGKMRVVYALRGTYWVSLQHCGATWNPSSQIPPVRLATLREQCTLFSASLVLSIVLQELPRSKCGMLQGAGLQLQCDLYGMSPAVRNASSSRSEEQKPATVASPRSLRSWTNTLWRSHGRGRAQARLTRRSNQASDRGQSFFHPMPRACLTSKSARDRVA